MSMTYAVQISIWNIEYSACYETHAEKGKGEADFQNAE